MNGFENKTSLITFENQICLALIRTALYTLVSILLSTTLFAQQAKQYAFRHFSTRDGLAANGTGTVMQDKEGYIWIGTQNGLQRYDGNNFITFRNRVSDPASVPTDYIPSMFQDSKGNFWIIGDNNKVGLFDTKRFVFKEVPVPAAHLGFYLPQNVDELPTGEIMLMRVDGTAFRYDEKNKRFVRGEDVLHVPEKWKCTQFAWDSSGKKLWLSCDSGLVQYNAVTKHVNYKGHNIDHDPNIEAYKNITQPFWVYSAKDGDLVFTTWPYGAPAPTVFRYNKQLGKQEEFSMGSLLGYHEINGFLQQRNGKLWIYGAAFLAEWNRNNSKDPFSIIVNKYSRDAKWEYCYKAIEDREGNIWLATDNGIYYFSPDDQIFNNYNCVRPGGEPMQLNVTAAEELDDKRILVGTWGGRLLCYDQKLEPLPLPSSLKAMGEYISIWDMTVNSRTRDVWITLQGGGIVVYNQKTGAVIHSFPDIFQKSTIRQVDEDTSGNLWFGTQNGRVIKWDLKKSGGDPDKGYELIAQTKLVQKIHFDYQGFIYVGTMGDGLIKIDTKTNRVVHQWGTGGKEGEKLFSDVAYDMTWYNDSTLIVTAGCINIINTRTNKVRWITIDQGLPGNNACSIQRDRYGVLWVGLSNGICRFNLEKNVISYFDRRDGIAYDKLVPAGVTHLGDGRIMFFTEHDFLVFDPKDFGQQMAPPRPLLTSFKLNEQFLSLDSLVREKRIVLDYDNTSIAIGFSALSYLQQRKVHYFYMLEGVDKDWIHTDRPIEAIYNSLPPGDYVFKVKSENADGMTSEEIVSIPIIVRPPFWKSWWFLCMIGLFIILILYLIDRERLKRRMSLRLVRRQIRANLKEEISETLNNINVLSEIAKIKADKNVEQAKDFIDQISDKSRYMNEVLDDTLWSIDPANDSMKKFVLRMKELTEGWQASHNVEIDLIVDKKVQSLELDMKLRYELLFFYKEAMHFIIENIQCKQVFVNINRTRSKLYMEILSECSGGEAFKTAFQKAVQKRAEALSASMDVLADSKSFCSVVYIEV